MSSGYVLWLPKSRLVQLSTDGVMPGDAPPLREALPPDLDLRVLRDDLDPQIDEQPPIVADPLSPDHRRLRNAGPPRKKTTTYKGATRIDRDADRHLDGRRISATYGSMERVLRATCAVSRSRPCDDRRASVPSVRWRINGTKL
jgi:hypothetical protein